MPPTYAAFSFFSAPLPRRGRISPRPLPGGKGGPRLFYARGFAPCIPGDEPKRHWLSLPYTCPRGGRAFFVACLHCLLYLFCPPSPKGKDIPPPPSQREGGDHKLVLPGATAPGTPALNRLRRLQSQRNRHSGGKRVPETALTVSAHPVGFFPGSRHEPRLLRSYIREKFWGVWGTLSRVPRRCSLVAAPPIIHLRKVLGGLGDSFKSPPALLLSRGSSNPYIQEKF